MSSEADTQRKANTVSKRLAGMGFKANLDDIFFTLRDCNNDVDRAFDVQLEKSLAADAGDGFETKKKKTKSKDAKPANGATFKNRTYDGPQSGRGRGRGDGRGRGRGDAGGQGDGRGRGAAVGRGRGRGSRDTPFSAAAVSTV